MTLLSWGFLFHFWWDFKSKPLAMSAVQAFQLPLVLTMLTSRGPLPLWPSFLATRLQTKITTWKFKGWKWKSCPLRFTLIYIDVDACSNYLDPETTLKLSWREVSQSLQKRAEIVPLAACRCVEDPWWRSSQEVQHFWSSQEWIRITRMFPKKDVRAEAGEAIGRCVVAENSPGCVLWCFCQLESSPFPNLGTFGWRINFFRIPNEVILWSGGERCLGW